MRYMRYVEKKGNKLPPGMSPRDVEKMKEELEKHLMNGAGWILEHAFLVAEYHLEDDFTKKSRLLAEIGRSEERGHKKGYSQPQIRALNRVILDAREKGNLEELYKKIKDRIPHFQKEIEQIKKGKR